MKTILIMGPCAIEGKQWLVDVAGQIKEQFDEVGPLPTKFDYYFKSSFDKANRTSVNSFRGLGMDKGLEALQAVKDEYGFKLLTDIHETYQANPVGSVVDVIQIPAFLCRQTSLIQAAARTGRIVNVKKGQQMPASAMMHAAQKCLDSGADEDNIWLTERGTFMGYGDVVVDMRNLIEMTQWGKVIFDATHSVQKPGGADGTTGGNRDLVFPLLRGACAVGLDGAFLEVHPDPDNAKSDAGSQIPIKQIPRALGIISRIKP